MSELIGFIGLGIMGKPMARNLIKAGYSLTLHDLAQPAVDELVAAGAVAAANAREVAERSDIVIIVVPDAPDVEVVLRGPDGVFAGAHDGLLLIDMSTIAPLAACRLAREAAEHGLQLLDAPVSGGDKGAISATLSIMVGGDSSAFERALPVFQALGKTITYCGANGAGQIVKACNQVAVALSIAAVSEALVLGSRAGVQPEIVLQVLRGGLAQSRVMDLRGPTMIEHRFEPGFKARLHSKDLRIILETAREYRTALPFSALADQLFTALIANGGGDLDHSALLTVIESLSTGSQPQA